MSERVDVPSREQTAKDINLISSFLSHEPPNTTLEQLNPSIIVLCGSAILHTSHVTFKYLQSCSAQQRSSNDKSNPKLHTLVIAGGIGHSTSHLYDAVRRHPIYGTHFQQPDSRTGNDRLQCQAEAAVLDEIRRKFYPLDAAGGGSGANLKVIVEDQSTNCGANAECARKVLEQHGICLGLELESKPAQDVVVVQDPTMALRTLECFEKTYADVLAAASSTASASGGNVRFHAFPTFVPAVKAVLDGSQSDAQAFVWDVNAPGMEGIENVDGLWDMKRFYGLLMGEVPRLRDDANGYGPKGKGFIGHVDIPEEVEAAWDRLRQEGVLDVKR